MSPDTALITVGPDFADTLRETSVGAASSAEGISGLEAAGNASLAQDLNCEFGFFVMISAYLVTGAVIVFLLHLPRPCSRHQQGSGYLQLCWLRHLREVL